MRRPLAVVALMSILMMGQSVSASDWRFWRSSKHDPNPYSGCFDDSPLCPQLSPWLLESSHCKPPLCSGGQGCHQSTGGPVFFPPLPYSYRAYGAASPPGAGSVLNPAAH
jgi:hypothetical protein